ncbi:MAG: hypothetical protein ACOY0T_15615 [Myxococcota bacterium]
MSFKKVLAILFGLLVLGLLGMGVLVAVFLPRFVHAEVVEQAKRRGIELEPGDIGFGLGWLQVKDAKLGLVGVPAIRATAKIIDVELARFTAQRFTLNQVTLEAVGEPTQLEADLGTWLRAHEAQFTEPVFVKPLSVQVRREPKGEAQLELDGAEISADKDQLRLVANSVALAGRKLGALRLNTKKDIAEIALTLGLSELANPLLSVEARQGELRKIHIALAPVTVARLGTALEMPLPLPNVTASGTFDLELPRAMTPLSHPSGRFDATLKGYIPPHPVELDGFVFGDVTEISSRFSVLPEQLRIQLEETRLKAGAFELKGGGSLGVEAGAPRLRLNLSGTLPCAALAGATAESRLGVALGRVTAKAARETLNGVVGVKVSVEAGLMELDKPRVLKTIVPGCGLKPLSIRELRALGELLPEALDPRVGDDLAKILSGPLPTLPNLGPDTKIDLSKMPALPLPTLPLPLPSAAKPAAPRASASGR